MLTGRLLCGFWKPSIILSCQYSSLVEVVGALRVYPSNPPLQGCKISREQQGTNVARNPNLTACSLAKLNRYYPFFSSFLPVKVKEITPKKYNLQVQCILNLPQKCHFRIIIAWLRNFEPPCLLFCCVPLFKVFQARLV